MKSDTIRKETTQILWFSIAAHRAALLKNVKEKDFCRRGPGLSGPQEFLR